LHGRTVVIPGKDQQFNTQVLQNPVDEDKDKGNPQAYYFHNVMPTGWGLQSVGYTDRISGIGSSEFDGIYVLRDIDENKFLFSPAGGKNYVFDGDVGSGIPEDIKGKIVVCLPITNGFIIYCTKNAVGASFSQNVRYPFVFKEVESSAGIASMDHISWQDNANFHYAWTQAGLQKVNKSKAELVFPEISDFLASKKFETFNETTFTLEITKLTSQFKLKLAIIGRRYFAISYGITELTHVLVYDVALKRWGKLKIDHVAVFEYSIPNLYGDITWDMLQDLTWDDLGDTTWDDLGSQVRTLEQAKETLAILAKDGSIVTVNFDQAHTNDDGILILGKISIRKRTFYFYSRN
jgi:hypothetical protein